MDANAASSGEGARLESPGERMRAVLRAGAPILAVMVAVSLAAAVPLAGEEVVLHRGADGQPTRTGAATELLVLFPAAAVVLLAILAGAARSRPRDATRVPPSPGVMAALTAITLGLFAVVHLVAVADALGWLARPVEWLIAVVGLAYLLGGGLLVARTERALALVNVPWRLGVEGRRRVVRVSGACLVGLGLATVVLAVAAPIRWGVLALVAGSALLGPVLLVVAARARAAGP